ncbi:uncharacterized protein LOC129779455 [Toxorhynchites rutilus septentrionalis]|uniref:uncharacterized protein LOC129779455 n=1 Tax=Toxorhynchites rutilus septentrionalis TaxID=329112 RepID=UPI002479915B|nr:uncharacterized protein LOC129779455 [Toxorhynchites rutilus septentrionalis]
MKFIAAVVMMAFALAAEAGYISLIYNTPLVYTDHSTIVQRTQADPIKIKELSVIGYSSPIQTYTHPFYYAYDSVPTFLLQKEARFLAANRGALHEAPLPGHEISQIQLNLEPAPGSN